MTKAHAIKTAEVRRSLGRGDDVIGRHRQRCVGQADGNALRTQLFDLRQRGFDRGTDILGQAFAEVLDRYPDAQPTQRLVRRTARKRRLQIPCVIFRWALERRGVTRVKTAHGAQHHSRVLGAARHHPALIQARGKRDHAVARHHAISGLDSGNAGKGGRLPYRTAGIGGCGRRRKARRHDGGRPAGGAPRHVLGIPRILHRAIE